MKRAYLLIALLLAGVMLMSMALTGTAEAWQDEDSRAYLHQVWEGEHATMINALLITKNDQIVKHHDRYVQLYECYRERDPLLEVYYLREKYDSSIKDAFLMGLKANNLIYLIHTADDNPNARRAAVKELKLLGKVVHSEVVQRQFPYWAELLEEGRYSSKRLSHLYVHYTIDIGEYYHTRMGADKRFYFWLGYLVNDFIVSHLCDDNVWLKTDQNYFWVRENQRHLKNLYSIRSFGEVPRFTLAAWYDLNDADLNMKKALDGAINKVEYIKSKYTNRGMN